MYVIREREGNCTRCSTMVLRLLREKVNFSPASLLFVNLFYSWHPCLRDPTHLLRTVTVSSPPPQASLVGSCWHILLLALCGMEQLRCSVCLETNGADLYNSTLTAATLASEIQQKDSLGSYTSDDSN